MNKTVATVVVVVLIALGGIGFVLTRNRPTQPANNTQNQLTASTQESEASSNNREATTQPSTDTSTATGEQKVTIENQAFTPATITVKPGTKVTWTNQDSVQHDVMPDEDYGDAFKASELLRKGESYSFTFTKPGTYKYFCTPHPFMKGTVVVTE